MHGPKAQPATHRYKATKHRAVSRCHGNFALAFREITIPPSKSTPGAPFGAPATLTGVVPLLPVGKDHEPSKLLLFLCLVKSIGKKKLTNVNEY